MPRHETAIRKSEIVKSARELIMHEGIKAVTIRNIAEKNRITEGAIYKHFKDKRSILLLLIEEFEANLLAAINSAIDKNKSPIEILKNIMMVHLKFTENRKAELFALTAASVHFDDSLLRKKILDVIEHYKARIQSILIEAKKKHLIRKEIDIDAASLGFFGLIQISSIQFALSGFKVPPIKKFAHLWDMFLNGILS